MSYSANRLLLFTVVMDTKVHALSPVCCHGKWIKLKNFKAPKAFIPANSVAQASWKSSPRVTDEASQRLFETWYQIGFGHRGTSRASREGGYYCQPNWRGCIERRIAL